jgi:hypothetical protein
MDSIGPPAWQDAQGRAAQGKDQAVSKTKDVRAAVEKELGFDPRVDSSDIKVANIGGTRKPHRHGAEFPAIPAGVGRRAAGRRVTSVDNNLEVVLPESVTTVTTSS